MQTVEISQLLGPLGGTIALAWAAGAASGYLFAVKIMKARIDFLENQIELNEKTCEARNKATAEALQSQINLIKDLLDKEIKSRNDRDLLDAKKGN